LAGVLATREWCYLGPVAFPLTRLARCCGPEAEMAYHDPPASWEGHIARMAADIRAGWRPPPLIAGTFGGWDRVLLDGNHRHAALLACGRVQHPVIFVSEGARERMAFAARGGIPARWRGRRLPAAA
jgi:hypothetical protein